MKRVRGIQRLADPSPEVFAERCVTPRQPGILTGVASCWPACGRWSPGHLASVIGTLEVSVWRSTSGMHPDLDSSGRPLADGESTTLGDFLGRLPHATRGALFVTGDRLEVLGRGGRLNPPFEPLAADFLLPALVPRDHVLRAGLWLSAAGVRSRLHFDANGADNLNAQVRGRKRVYLLSPEETANCYLYPPEDWRLHNFSRVDLAHPDPDRFPAFTRVTILEDVLESGELLYLPARWLHAFSHLGEFNANLNFWWNRSARAA